MSTEPDDWDRRPERMPPPGIVRAAGILWMVVGVVFILSGCANVVMTVLLQAQNPNRPAAGTEGCGLWLALGIGVGFLMSGKNLVSGKAKDVLSLSVLSILLGLFYLALGIGFVVLLARDGVAALVILGICGGVALGCIIPAVMALAGRSQYRAWRAAERSRRRRDDEDDDEDDGDDRDDDRGPKERPWDRGRGAT